MNTTPAFFFKSWIWCVLAFVALGVVSLAVQQGLSVYHHPAVLNASRAPLQETRALPDSAPETELAQVDIPVAVSPIESSSVSAKSNVAAPAMEAVAVSTVSDQTVPHPLAHAIKAIPNVALVGVDSPGNGESPTVDPPLVFTEHPKNLTPEQQTALAAIQDQFLKAIGDANQDPADPAYRDRWMNAQVVADQRYKALVGWPAFEQMQLQRAMNSYSEIQVP